MAAILIDQPRIVGLVQALERLTIGDRSSPKFRSWRRARRPSLIRIPRIVGNLTIFQASHAVPSFPGECRAQTKGRSNEAATALREPCDQCHEWEDVDRADMGLPKER